MVDLTPLYRQQVTRVHRSVTLNPDRTVAIDDQWTTGQQPTDVAWQWLTKATVTRTPQGLLLQQDGKSLALTIDAPTKTTITIEDVSAARNPQDSPNPGVTRIVIKLSTPAQQTATLRVKAIPGSRAK